MEKCHDFHRLVTATDKLNLRGSRTFCFFAGIDATNGLDVAEATVFLGSNTVARGGVNIHGDGTLALVQQKGDYAFSDLFPGGSVVNNGVFSFGSLDYEKYWAFEKTVTLGEGDVLTGPCDGRKNDESSAALYALSGGTLELGQNGFVEGDQWVTNGMDGSYYDFRLSGGRITPFSRNSQISARARLSDRDGGTEWFTRATDTMTVNASMFGDGGLRKTGPGTLILASGNDYTGPTDIQEGQIRLGIGRKENAVWRADDLFGAKNAGDAVAEWLRHASGGDEWTFKTTSFINGANAARRIQSSDPARGHGEDRPLGQRAERLPRHAAQMVGHPLQEGRDHVRAERSDAPQQGGVRAGRVHEEAFRPHRRRKRPHRALVKLAYIACHCW